jgi:hypothetical protein
MDNIARRHPRLPDSLFQSIVIELAHQVFPLGLVSPVFLAPKVMSYKNPEVQ